MPFPGAVLLQLRDRGPERGEHPGVDPVSLRQPAGRPSEVAGLARVDDADLESPIMRYSGEWGYRFIQVQGKADCRRLASIRPRKMMREFWAMVVSHLEEGWSSGQISGHFRPEEIPTPKAGRERIYRHIRADFHRGGKLC